MRKKAFNTINNQPNLMVYINTTPLIDVMLVLLIMIIITIPIRLHSVNLDLPEIDSEVVFIPKNLTEIEIDQFGVIKVGNRVVQNKEDLKILFALIAAKASIQNISINSHAKSNYGDIASVLFEARRAGIEEIGFVGLERF